MTYRGRVQNGVIVLEKPGSLPEGTEVEVAPMAKEAVPTLAERYKNLIGIAEGLPSDASVNHDHYLYGAPKK